MTLTATYMTDLSRVRVAFSGVPAAADYALVERSTDGVNWATVRGGSTVPINSGSGKIDDYEFVASAVNTYRASYVDSADITFVNQGTHATGNNTTVTPGLPASLSVGDTLLLFAATSTGTINTPTGWAVEATYGPMTVFSRRYVTGDTAPSVTFAGGTTGTPTSAFIAAWRNSQPGYDQVNGTINNTSAQDISVAPLSGIGPKRELIAFEWKQSGAATAGSTLTPFGGTVTLANATGQTLFYSRVSATSSVQSFPQQTMTVTGGVAAISRSLVFAYRRADYVTQETAGITPAPPSVWLKNPSRPSLNTAVTVTDWSDVTRPARTGVIDVVGRTMPVAVTDVQGSRRVTLTITTTNLADATDMDKRLATGEPVFLQAPAASCPIPTMYAVIGDTAQKRTSKRTTRRYWDLPLIEVAAPASVVAGDTILYADVAATWATYADVLAAKATYSDLIDSISTAVVIVP